MNASEAALRLRSYLDYIKTNRVDQSIWEPMETAIDCLMGNYADDPRVWTVEAIEEVMRDEDRPHIAENGKMIYPCDPSLNTKCLKTGCYVHGGPCSTTFDKEFARKL